MRGLFFRLEGVSARRGEEVCEVSDMKMGAFSKEVAVHLGISPNTLRRWCLELESKGYSFERNNNDQRVFYDRDIVALSEVQNLLGQRQSMEDATKTVAVKYKDKENAEKMMGVIKETGDSIALSPEQLQNMLELAASRGAQLALEKFNSTLEHRDRSLIHELRESLDQKRLETAFTAERTDEESVTDETIREKEQEIAEDTKESLVSLFFRRFSRKRWG